MRHIAALTGAAQARAGQNCICRKLHSRQASATGASAIAAESRGVYKTFTRLTQMIW